MAYNIVFTARAESDLLAILEDDSGRYTPAQQRAYVLNLRREVFALNPWPKRGTVRKYKGHEYRRLNFKAHTAFFRVFDDSMTVEIEAVLHSHMNFKARL